MFGFRRCGPRLLPCEGHTNRVYVELPKEDFEDGKCGVLKKTMYGTRDAAQSWEMEYIEMMINTGFVQGAVTAHAFSTTGNGTSE